MKINNNLTVKKIVMTGLIAAIYAVATIALPFASYNAIQFRFSEVLTLMAFVDSSYIPGLVLGCAIANMFSPLGIIDVLVGTSATFISVFLISKTKNLFRCNTLAGNKQFSDCRGRALFCKPSTFSFIIASSWNR